MLTGKVFRVVFCKSGVSYFYVSFSGFISSVGEERAIFSAIDCS